MVIAARRPDPEARRFVRVMSLVPPPRHSGPDVLQAARREWQLAVKAFATRERVADVQEVDIPGPDAAVRVRAYRPSLDRDDLPVLVWFHGGGYIMGDLYTAGATCRALANRSGSLVVAVRYRLAPEHPLHEGRADCIAAVRWLARHAGALGGNPSALAVGGDSAGGGIAALVAQQCAREGTDLRAQVLVYPSTSLAGTSQDQGVGVGILTPERVSWIRELIEQVTPLDDVESNPLFAENLTGLAPAIVLTCGFDPVCDQGLAYGDRLRDADVLVRSLHYPGQIHGFVTLDRVMSAGRDALSRLGRLLAAAFAGTLEPGLDDGLPGTGAGSAPRLDPRQRLREAYVGALVARERVGQLRVALGGASRPRQGEIDVAEDDAEAPGGTRFAR